MSTAICHHSLPPDAERELYSFTLMLSGVDEITEDVERAIFEAGCDDALLGMSNGHAFLAFDREAPSLTDAISAAIIAVEGCGLGIRVCRVVPPGEKIIEVVNSILRMREAHPEVWKKFMSDIHIGNLFG